MTLGVGLSVPSGAGVCVVVVGVVVGVVSVAGGGEAAVVVSVVGTSAGALGVLGA
jgi:hypothetical protein